MKIHPKHQRHLKHILILIAVSLVAFIVFVFIGNVYYDKLHPPLQDVTLGVTFSDTYAKFLLPDWKQAYLDVLNNLHVKYLRLPMYWEEIEPKPGIYQFADADFMLQQAQKSHAKVILAAGIKLPRWPECHMPDWAKGLTVTERQNQTKIYLQKVMERYKDNPTLSAWQIENEPLLSFGSETCDPPDREFLKSEVDLARQIDPHHPIILTDSGELRLWVTPMQLSDVLGTTLYRSVYNPLFGYFYYPLPPAFYNLKSKLVRQFFAPNNQKTIVIELQTEPWFPQGIPSAPLEQQMKVFSVSDFSQNLTFAKRTGFDEIYLWGVEWWYYMAAHGHPEYLNYAKTVLDY